MTVETIFRQYAVEKLEQLMQRIEVCAGKLSEDQIWFRRQENENAIGNLLLHLRGNLRQWILSPFGGHPLNRDRDGEFDARGGFTARELTGRLRETVDAANAIVAGLTAEQLTRAYEVQNYHVSGVEAVFHVVEHFSQHAGQIIYATKMLSGEDLGFYKHLTSPVHTEHVP